VPGIWRDNPATAEGKYPIVLRRDGTPLEARYFVIALKDPAANAALHAYADAGEACGFDSEYVAGVRKLAKECWDEQRKATRPADPDAPPHRKDDPAVLAWARSIGCPGGA
jgi:hypothetical protein